jgi:hypothetical protein
MNCQRSALSKGLHTVNRTYNSLVHICQCFVHLRIMIEGAKLLDWEFAAFLHAYQFWYELEQKSVKNL